MNKESQLFYRLVRDFLTVYLPRQRSASPNTVKAYKDTLNIFLGYLKQEQTLPMQEIAFQCITQKNVEDFLEWLEQERKNSIASRNQRLSGLKAFYKYAASKDRTLMIHYQEMLNIPKKKHPKGHEIEFFNESALQSILKEPDTKKKNGYRDLIFLLLLYDTAARVQELLDVCIQDIYIEGKSPYIRIIGKGKKTRLVPVMNKTVEHLQEYLSRFHEISSGSEFLFYIERKGKRTAMSPDNVEKFIKKYGKQARKENREVPEHLFPHMFRHSRSMHLYRNGMPLPLLAEWLGHSQMETTITYYANADTKMKKDALEKATAGLNPLFQDNPNIHWEDDDEMIKKLYGLL